jgi:Cu-Zn family superoxide dismutase
MLRALLLASLLALPACGQEAEETPPMTGNDETQPAGAQAAAPGADTPSGEGREIDAQIIGDTGEAIGTVELLEGPNGVIMTLELEDESLSPGWHGLHIHAVGDCSDTGEFKRSGGHLGKIEGGHGLLNPQGPEKGDLPNIHVDEAGRADAQIFSNLFVFADLRDEDGAALIMHESMDDHISQPIGGAGARVACAVLSGPNAR